MNKLVTLPLLLLIYILTLTGCNELQARDRMTKFEETFRLYAKHLRWGHFPEVTGFMTPEHVAPSLSHATKLKEIRISGVTPINWIVDEAQENISGNVTVSYYVTNRGVIRETTQQQTWIWQSEGKNWKLNTGLPDLK